MLRSDSRYCLFIACILIAAFSFLYTDTPDSADEKAIIATAASLVGHGRLDMNAAGASDWLLLPLSRLGTFGSDGALYAKKGIVPALAIAPLAAFGRYLPWLSARAAAMLFNLIITMLTALSLFGFSRRLGYRARTAVAASLVYGLCTLALVYVKTAFGEPLAGLLLISALWAAWGARQPTGTRIDLRLLVCGGALAALIGINAIYAVFVPIIALYVFDLRALSFRSLIAFGVPLLIGGVLLLVFNAARFGSPFNSGYNFALGEGFTHPFLRGLYGLTIGPQRGLFWYSPLLILAIPGFYLFARRFGRLSVAALALIVIQVIAFAAWWSWHGGIVWGPRFMLPAIPLAILFLLPIIDSAWHHRLLFGIVALFALVSFGVITLGAIYSYFPFVGYLFRQFAPFGLDGVMADSFFYDSASSPIIGHWALLWAGVPSSLRAVMDMSIMSVIALILIAAGIVALRLRRRLLWLYPALLIAALFSLPARAQDSAMRQQVHALDTVIDPPGFVVGATTLFDDALVDLRGPSRVITMNAPTDPADERARQIWQYALQQDRLLWLVTWFGPHSPENWQEKTLWESAYFGKEIAVAGHRALLFALPSETTPTTEFAGGWRYANHIALESHAINRSSDGLLITLRWKNDQPIVQNDAWFVHLLDPNGQIAQQQDRQPAGGYAPTVQWAANQSHTDRLFFALGSRVNLAGWQLRIGWVDPTSGAPYPVVAPNGATNDAPFVLLPIKP